MFCDLTLSCKPSQISRTMRTIRTFSNVATSAVAATRWKSSVTKSQPFPNFHTNLLRKIIRFVSKMMQRVVNSPILGAIVTNGVQPHRGMATLKVIQMRLKSVRNIKKITQSMNMVSTAKYARAERDLKQARPYGEGAKSFYDVADIQADKEERKELYIGMTSDRGLCGAVHTGVARHIRNELNAKPGNEAENAKIICVGDKSRAVLQRMFAKKFIFVANEIGRIPPTFLDESIIAIQVLNAGYNFGHGKIVYNKFRTVVAYNLSTIPISSLKSVESFYKLVAYDSLDADIIRDYLEFSLASLLLYAMKESACSEQSSRMSAMDNATKNAGEMIEKLALTYNRTRQAVINRELIEIISGASALN